MERGQIIVIPKQILEGRIIKGFVNGEWLPVHTRTDYYVHMTSSFDYPVPKDEPGWETVIFITTDDDLLLVSEYDGTPLNKVKITCYGIIHCKQ